MSACCGAEHLDVTAGGQRRRRPARRLDPVRDRPVRVAVQLRHALDLDHPVGVHLDDRAHLLQDADQVDDLRLHGGVAQLGDALGHHRGEQHLLGRAHAGVGQRELGAAQAVRRGQVQPLGRLVDRGAELPQGLQVEVDRPRTDVAAAQVGDEGVPETVQQRTAEQDRDPAGAGVHVDLVGAGALHVRRVEDQLAVLVAVGDLDAVQSEQAPDHLHVTDLRHVEQPARAVAEECGDHRLGDQVLRAAHADPPLQRGASVYDQDVVGQRNLQRVRAAVSMWGHRRVATRERSRGQTSARCVVARAA